MSEPWRTLKQSHKEVNRLYQDIYAPAFMRQDWDGSVYARRSLGGNVQVEAWYLAEHFLLAWSDWAGLRDRYLRYFGQTERKLPKSWHHLDAKCRNVVDRLLRDQTLDVFVTKSWSCRPNTSRSDERRPCSRSVFHAIVNSHRRTMLQAMVRHLADTIVITEKQPRSQRPYWPEAFHCARQLNDELMSAWTELPQTLRGDTLRHLRNYQHASLVVSWLMHSHASDDRFMSALVNLVTRGKPMTLSIEGFASQLNIDPQQQRIVNEVLHRLQAAIAEVGYDNLVNDITSGEFLGGTDSPIGAPRINVIPSENDGVCCTTLVAVSKGEKRAIGFPSIMKQVREHLIRCIDKTKVVIILCDYWRPDMLADHLGDLAAHYDRGVRFLFLMVGSPGRAIAPVAVNLADRP